MYSDNFADDTSIPQAVRVRAQRTFLWGMCGPSSAHTRQHSRRRQHAPTDGVEGRCLLLSPEGGIVPLGRLDTRTEPFKLALSTPSSRPSNKLRFWMQAGMHAGRHCPSAACCDCCARRAAIRCLQDYNAKYRRDVYALAWTMFSVSLVSLVLSFAMKK